MTWHTSIRVTFLVTMVVALTVPVALEQAQPPPYRRVSIICAEVYETARFWVVELSEVAPGTSPSDISVQVYNPDGTVAFARAPLGSLAYDIGEGAGDALTFQQRRTGLSEVNAGDQILVRVSAFPDGAGFQMTSDWGVLYQETLSRGEETRAGCCCIVQNPRPPGLTGMVAWANYSLLPVVMFFGFALGVSAFVGRVRGWFWKMLLPAAGLMALIGLTHHLFSLVIWSMIFFGFSLVLGFIGLVVAPWHNPLKGRD